MKVRNILLIISKRHLRTCLPVRRGAFGFAFGHRTTTGVGRNHNLLTKFAIGKRYFTWLGHAVLEKQSNLNLTCRNLFVTYRMGEKLKSFFLNPSRFTCRMHPKLSFFSWMVLHTLLHWLSVRFRFSHLRQISRSRPHGVTPDFL